MTSLAVVDVTPNQIVSDYLKEAVDLFGTVA